MPNYKIYAGLGGGFGGAQYHCTREFKDQDDAEEFARELAMAVYDSYAGLHGTRDIQEIMNEDEVDEEEAERIYEEEMDSWITFKVIAIKENYEENQED